MGDSQGLLDDVYNPAKFIKPPKTIGVGPNSENTAANAGALIKYLGYLSLKPGLGDSYLLDIGECSDESEGVCAPENGEKKRMKWHVDNIPKGLIYMNTPLGRVSAKGLTAGMLEDGVDAFATLYDRAESKKCVPRTAMVGNQDKVTPVSFCGPERSVVLNQNMFGGGRKKHFIYLVVLFLAFLLFGIQFFSMLHLKQK